MYLMYQAAGLCLLILLLQEDQSLMPQTVLEKGRQALQRPDDCKEILLVLVFTLNLLVHFLGQAF